MNSNRSTRLSLAVTWPASQVSRRRRGSCAPRSAWRGPSRAVRGAGGRASRPKRTVVRRGERLTGEAVRAEGTSCELRWAGPPAAPSTVVEIPSDKVAPSRSLTRPSRKAWERARCTRSGPTTGRAGEGRRRRSAGGENGEPGRCAYARLRSGGAVPGPAVSLRAPARVATMIWAIPPWSASRRTSTKPASATSAAISVGRGK